MAGKVQRFEHYGEAYGFDCPGCGSMHILPVTGERGWGFNHNLEKPTFTPSILARSGNEQNKRICHSYVTDGKIMFLEDSTHELRGRTVELPEMEDLPDAG